MSAEPNNDVPRLHPVVKPGRERKTLHPVGLAGVAALAGGLLGWLWLSDWRWAVSGLLVMFVLLVVGSTLDAGGRT